MVHKDGMDSLGDELLARVFLQCSPPVLATAEGVCRRWRRVCEEHAVWQHHAQAAEGALKHNGLPVPDLASSPLHTSWKARFLERKFLHACSSLGSDYTTVALVLTAHERAVACCALSGSQMATGGFDKVARVWDLQQRDSEAHLPTPRLLHALPHPSPVIFAALPAPGILLTATPACGYVWRGSQLLRRLGDASSLGQSLIRSAAAWDMYFVAGLGDGSVRIYDLYSGALLKLLRPHRRAVTAVLHVAHQDWDLLLSAAEGEDAVAVTDVETGLQLAEAVLPPVLRSAALSITSLALDPSLGLLAAAANGTSIASWDCGPHLSLVPTPSQRVDLDSPKTLKSLGYRTGVAATCLALPAFGGAACLLAGARDGGLEPLLWEALRSPPAPGSNSAIASLQQLPFPRSFQILPQEQQVAMLGVGWAQRLELPPGGLPPRWALAQQQQGGAGQGLQQQGGAGQGLQQQQRQRQRQGQQQGVAQAQQPSLGPSQGLTPNTLPGPREYGPQLPPSFHARQQPGRASPAQPAGTSTSRPETGLHPSANAAAAPMAAAGMGAGASSGRSGSGSGSSGSGQGVSSTSGAGAGTTRGQVLRSGPLGQRLSSSGEAVELELRACFPAQSSAWDCSCISAAEAPVVTGHLNGQVVLWGWRRRERWGVIL